MKHLSLRRLGALSLLCCGLPLSASWADPLAAVQLLRVSGCAGVLPAAQPLQHNAQLDRAAALWSEGATPAAATVRTGYRAKSMAALRVSGSDDSILLTLRRTQCRTVADRSLRDLGIYRRGRETWIVMAAPDPQSIATSISVPVLPAMPSARDAEVMPARTFSYATAPSPARTASSGTQVLQLVNEVRASGTRCGDKSFGPAPPLKRSGTLDQVAKEHAADMARHDYFEHVDLNGNTPADRLRATGYREKLIGENIAYGPTSAQEVVAGWLHSTGHCENIMDPRFVEMGLAVAPGRGSRRGLYWDQELAQPVK